MINTGKPLNILFAIQGTGNGHLSRARDVYPELAKYGNVDVLISGIQADVAVPFPVKYKFYGMSFIFGKNGGVDMLDTARKLKLFRLIRDIRELPVKDYDLVINDFEPVSAWACRRRRVPCISLSHQCAVLHPQAPQPLKRDMLGYLVLKHYAPVSASYGFHFSAIADNIFTPVIRKEIRSITPTNFGHYTVYLPAYSDDKIIETLSRFPGIQWQVFSKHTLQPFETGNISVRKIDNDAFVVSMASAAGVLLGAGFEGPAEAMYLGKKVMVVPMHAQYEQHCNAAGAASMGVSVVPHLGPQYHHLIDQWISFGTPVQVSYPDLTALIIEHIIRRHAPHSNK